MLALRRWCWMSTHVRMCPNAYQHGIIPRPYADMVHVYPTLVDGLGHEAAEGAIRRAVDFALCVTSHTGGEHHPSEACLAGSQHLHGCRAATPRACVSRRQLALPEGLLSLSIRDGGWSPERSGALRVVRSPGSGDARRGLAGLLELPVDRVSSPSLSEASSAPLQGEILTVVGSGVPGVSGVSGVPVPALPMAMPLWEGTKVVLPTAPLGGEVASIEQEEGLPCCAWEADFTVLQLML